MFNQMPFNIPYQGLNQGMMCPDNMFNNNSKLNELENRINDLEKRVKVLEKKLNVSNYDNNNYNGYQSSMYMM